MSLQVLDRRQKPCRVVSEHSQARITLAAKKIANRPGGVAVIDGQPVGGTAYGTSGSKAVDIRIGKPVPSLPMHGGLTSALAVRTSVVDVVEIVYRPEFFTPWASSADFAARVACQLPAAGEKSNPASDADSLSPLGIRHASLALGGWSASSATRRASDVIKLVKCLSLLALGALLGLRHKKNFNTRCRES